MKRFFCFCIVVFILAALPGCVDRLTGEDTEYSTGEILTPEMIESIFAEVSASVTEKYPTDTMEDGSYIVYWLPGGSVWHISLNCGSVSKASPDSLCMGSVSDAIAEGKTRGCKICTSGVEFGEYQIPDSAVLSDTDAAQVEKYPEEYDINGDLVVYWTKSGKVWHISPNCSSLSKTSDSDIVKGTEKEAKDSGKERVCKVCSKEK